MQWSNIIDFYNCHFLKVQHIRLVGWVLWHINLYRLFNAKSYIHTHIYIYIYIDAYLIEHNIHFLSTYVFVNHFKLPYRSYDIQRELVDKPSIISYFPSTFSPNLGHHQGKVYYKRDVTFVCTLLLYKNQHLYCCIV